MIIVLKLGNGVHMKLNEVKQMPLWEIKIVVSCSMGNGRKKCMLITLWKCMSDEEKKQNL